MNEYVKLVESHQKDTKLSSYDSVIANRLVEELLTDADLDLTDDDLFGKDEQAGGEEAPSTDTPLPETADVNDMELDNTKDLGKEGEPVKVLDVTNMPEETLQSILNAAANDPDFVKKHEELFKTLKFEQESVVPGQDGEKLEEEEPEELEDLGEGKKKPSAGLSKDDKSNIVKKAKKGKDIGKKGKGFAKVAAKAKEYGAENPEAVAASAMWKAAAAKKAKKVVK